MARYQFATFKPYPARLCTVAERPLENAKVSLLRLEFEVFEELRERRLRSLGEFACRDVVVGEGINPADAGM